MASGWCKQSDHHQPWCWSSYHDDVIKWKHLPRYWPFVRGIHRSPVNSPAQRPVTRSYDVSLIYGRINGWVNTGEAGDLRRYRAHYDVTVMISEHSSLSTRWVNRAISTQTKNVLECRLPMISTITETVKLPDIFPHAYGAKYFS